MEKQQSYLFRQILPYSMLLVLVFAFGGIIAIANHRQFPSQHRMDEGDVIAYTYNRYQLSEGKRKRKFNLVDPEMAPEEEREKIMQGYRLLMNTQVFAKEYVGASINCTNCHFRGGNSLGGKNSGISLVGVTEKYPRFSTREGRKISLAERINNCFERSMKGKPLPVDGTKMEAILAYFKWISKEVESFDHLPWLGLQSLNTSYQGDYNKGKSAYESYCSECHQTTGEGTAIFPPIWGEKSFNDGAGMSNKDDMASFIYENMPLMDPSLTKDEALDIAEYVTSQPRPHFKNEETR